MNGLPEESLKVEQSTPIVFPRDSFLTVKKQWHGVDGHGVDVRPGK